MWLIVAFRYAMAIMIALGAYALADVAPQAHALEIPCYISSLVLWVMSLAQVVKAAQESL